MSSGEHDVPVPSGHPSMAVTDALPTVHLQRHLPHRRSFFGSLQWRLSFWYVGLVILLLVGLGLTLLLTVSRLLYDNAAHTFQEDALIAATARRGPFLSAVIHQDAATKQWICQPYPDAFQMQVSDRIATPQAADTLLLLDARDGTVLAPTGMAGSIPPNLDRALLAQWYQGPRAWSATIASISKSYKFYHIMVAGVPGEVMLVAYTYHNTITGPCSAQSRSLPAVVMIVHTFSSTQQTVQSFEALLGISIGLVLVVGLAVGVFITRTSLHGLARVSATARLLARGDLHQRVNLPARGDEIGDVAQTFDEMAERLELAFKEQQASEQRVRQFLADASHELKTPITSIRGYLDVLARVDHSNPREIDYILGAARREAERMSRLVIDLVTLARFDTGRPLELVPTDLGALAGDAVDQARLLAGARQVALTGDGSGKLIVPVDPDRMKQVLLVLLDNALKYGRQDASTRVQVHVQRTSQAAIIMVSDNGPGIDPADLDHIFDRFYRGNRRQVIAATPDKAVATDPVNGSGLGLAIAHAIVLAHKGQIDVQSHPGQGTTFRIKIPLDG